METKQKVTNTADPIAIGWNERTEIELLEMVYNYASNGLRQSRQAKEWLSIKKLTPDSTMACYNSGQLHHRKELAFKQALERIGFMKRINVGVNSDTVPYTIFGNFSIMFPLRDANNHIVNFYAVSMKDQSNRYLNQEGFYPAIPDNKTQRLFIADTILDAATLLESKVLNKEDSIISLHDGVLLEQHKKVIQSLKHLTEVIQITTKK